MVAFKTLFFASAALLNIAHAAPTPEAGPAEAVPWTMDDDYGDNGNLTNTHFDDGTPFSAAEFHYGEYTKRNAPQKRQTTLLSGFIAWLGPLVLGKIDGTPPVCSDSFISEGTFYYGMSLM
jgi:hypothetical protein